MRSFLLTWNPSRWNWESLDDDVERLRRGGSLPFRWSCGVRRDLPRGSRFYLARLGDSSPEQKGLIGRGITLREPYPDTHWSKEGRKDSALYVEVEFDSLSATPVIPLPALRELSPTFTWTPQASGVEIPTDLGDALETAWAAVPSFVTCLPEELDPREPFIEGRGRMVLVNAHERSREARDACVQHHGSDCAVCGLDFGEKYGPLAEGYIHVHHHVPLADVNEEYTVDPVKDLVPVCPNCHAVIHLSRPPLSVAAVREMLRRGHS